MNLASKQFFAPPEGYDTLEKASFVVAGVPVEATVSYGGGTARGPAALLEASQQVELFDVDERTEPYRKGIATLACPDRFSDARVGAAYAKEVTDYILSLNKIPIIIGGEHSLSAGVAQSLASQHASYSILHFDAHGDLRDSYHGEQMSHASALRRCLDVSAVSKLVQVGIRNVSNDPVDGSEFDFIQKNRDRIAVYYAKDRTRWDIDEIVGCLGDTVYITFDVDAFDGSIMPSTGTPEPGGLDWDLTLAILKKACQDRRVIAVDVVEFAPIAGLHAPDFLVAKMIYKLIGFIRVSG